jgi:hypothetical protein
MQLGYEFQAGSYKGLSLLLQVNSVTNSAFQTTGYTSNQVRGWEKHGRQMLFGVNYKL